MKLEGCNISSNILHNISDLVGQYNHDHRSGHTQPSNSYVDQMASIQLQSSSNSGWQNFKKSHSEDYGMPQTTVTTGPDVDVFSLVSQLKAAVVIAKKVGNSRRKYKVNPPETNGPIEFVCTFRAQQNCTEWFPIFITALWGAGLFFHQVPAAIVGLVFVYSRHKYFHDYSERASKRVSPFWMGAYCVLLMFFMAGIGLTHQLLKMYAGVDLVKKALALYYGSL